MKILMQNNLLQNDNPQYVLVQEELFTVREILRGLYYDDTPETIRKIAETLFYTNLFVGNNQIVYHWLERLFSEVSSATRELANEMGRKDMQQAQYDLAMQIMAQEQLTASDYFFFFHLYVGLVNGNEKGQKLANKLNTTRASSMVYKNEIFTNHLMYVVLLFLANPEDESSNYKWNKAQLKKFLQDITNVLNETHKPNELVESLKNEIAVFIKRLENKDGFPNAARADFSNRLANTLGQLDKMRKS
jgi:hypothetical protein